MKFDINKPRARLNTSSGMKAYCAPDGTVYHAGYWVEITEEQGRKLYRIKAPNGQRAFTFAANMLEVDRILKAEKSEARSMARSVVGAHSLNADDIERVLRGGEVDIDSDIIDADVLAAKAAMTDLFSGKPAVDPPKRGRRAKQKADDDAARQIAELQKQLAAAQAQVAELAAAPKATPKELVAKDPPKDAPKGG